MPVTIVKRDQVQELKVDDSVFLYKLPGEAEIFSALGSVFGKDTDLTKIDFKSLSPTALSGLATSIAKLAIIGWENVNGEDKKPIDFEFGLIEFIPFDIRVKIFTKAMNFLVSTVPEKAKPQK